MPERPDLRAIAGNIREALADCERDALLDILTFVFKEYVVEGPPPLLASQVERLPDLENLSFGDLIGALQTRLPHPELSLFEVHDGQVLVRVGGILTPLTPPERRGSSPAPPPASRTAGEQAGQRPMPGVRVVETDIVRRPPGQMGAGSGGPRRGDVAGMAREAVNQAMQADGEGSAPPPRRGLSVRGRGGAGSFMPGASGQQASPPASQSAQPGQNDQQGQGQAQAQPPAPDSEPEHPGDEDSASTRFSLLELD